MALRDHQDICLDAAQTFMLRISTRQMSRIIARNEHVRDFEIFDAWKTDRIILYIVERYSLSTGVGICCVQEASDVE